MRYYTLLLAISSIVWFGCNSESAETTGPIPANQNIQQPAASVPFGTDTNSLQSLPGTPTTLPSPTSSNLNPPHGQPGHRCDIEVGKPLDSKPIQASIPPSSNPQTITTLPQQPTTLPSGGNVNPAHGQPGHRCDIAVGAPLN